MPDLIEGWTQELRSGKSRLSPDVTWFGLAEKQVQKVYTMQPLMFKHPVGWSNEWQTNQRGFDEPYIPIESYVPTVHSNFVKNKKLRSSANDKNIFLCITGQIGRLNMIDKFEKIIDPYTKLGYSVHVGLSLQMNTKLSFTNNLKTRLSHDVQPSYKNIEEVKDLLEFHHVDADISLIDTQHIAYDKILQFGQSFLKYTYALDKKWMSPGKKLMRATNHFKQYELMSKCADIYENKVNQGVDFEFALKMRDDAIPLINILDLDIIPKHSLVSSKCQSWGGVNDKMYFISSDIAPEVFL